MTPEAITTLIQQHLTEAEVKVTGAEGKFTAEIICEDFNGLSIIKRHRMVYAAVNDEIASGELHALTIVAKTREEA